MRNSIQIIYQGFITLTSSYIFVVIKFHEEMAVEGIEYEWVVEKGMYRKIKLHDKKRTDIFYDNVKTCLSTNEKLTKQNIRSFSKHARSYMLAYYSLGKKEEDEHNIITYRKIEQLAKSFKTHRCALDFDTGYVKEFIDAAPTTSIEGILFNHCYDQI